MFFHWPLLNKFNKWPLSFCCLTQGRCRAVFGCVDRCSEPFALLECVDRCSEPSARVLSPRNTVKMHIRKVVLDPSLKLESPFVVAGWGKERVGENTHWDEWAPLTSGAIVWDCSPGEESGWVRTPTEMNKHLQLLKALVLGYGKDCCFLFGNSPLRWMDNSQTLIILSLWRSTSTCSIIHMHIWFSLKFGNCRTTE